MKNRVLTGLILLSALSFNADAQQRRNHEMYSDNSLFSQDNGNLMQRMSLGGGMYFTQQKFDLTYIYPKDGSKANALRNAKVKGALTGSLDFSLPVSRISAGSNVSLSLGLMVAMAKLTHDTVEFGNPGSNLLYMKERKMMMAGVPIGIEYKTGGDAICSKTRRTMFSAGVGIQPSMISVKEDGQDSIGNRPPGKIKVKDPSATYSHFGVAPYAKVEAGFYAGIAFKLRLVAYFGEMNLIKESVKDSDFMVKTSGGYGYTASLIIMPFSMSWKRD